MKRFVLALGALSLLPSCQVLNSVRRGDNPVTTLNEVGKVSANLAAKQAKCDGISKREVPWEEETQIGGAVALALANKTGGVFIEVSPQLSKPGMPSPAEWAGKKPTPATGPKTDLNAYVNQVGKYLARASSRPSIDWTFMVMESEAPNAFSAPGGYVVVTTGLLSRVTNEAELAFVLAHEIGHVVHRDAINHYRTTKEATCRASAAVEGLSDGSNDMASLGFDLKNATGELIVKITDAVVDVLMKGNEKQAELAADKTAFELMANSGYDVKEIEKLFAKIPDGSGWLTPHPSNADRVSALKQVNTEFAKEYEGLIDLSTLKAPANEAQLSVVKKK